MFNFCVQKAFCSSFKPKNISRIASADMSLKERFVKWVEHRERAADLFDELEEFIQGSQSPFPECRQVLLRYNLVLMSSWIMMNRLREERYSIRAHVLRRSLDRVLYVYVKDSVYQFKDYFDRDVYHELRRLQRTMFYALDDYFLYGLKEKPIQQIIEEDIFLSQESGIENQQMENFIIKQTTELRQLTIKQIEKFHVNWGI